MNILVISDAVLPTPFPGGHGLGFMVYSLAERLKERGHRVCLFAKPGSQFSGELVTPDDANGYAGEKALAREAMRFWRTGEWDVVFDHSHLHEIARVTTDIPTVNVYHDNFQDYRRCPVVLSEGQRALLPVAFEHAPVVHNALNPDEYHFADTPEDFALFVGALSDIKQPLLAVEACAKAGVRLVMAGNELTGKFPVSGNENVEFVGRASPARRNDLMRRARVFLQLGAVESFGLTTLEANLHGTPVVAWPSGGSVDIIENRVNGVFVPAYGRNKAQAVADAMATAWWLDRERVRDSVVRRFSVDRQMNTYEYLLAQAAMGNYWR